ncbi:MAG: DUF642 domain-containing protein [Verrucomicrobiota bacterium]
MTLRPFGAKRWLIRCFFVSLCLALGGVGIRAAAPVLRVLPLGDSITAGCCIAIEGGYRTRLYNLLLGAGYTPDFIGNQRIDSNNSALPDPDHEGHGGYHIGDIDAGIDGWLSTVDDPDLVLLLIGTNDFGSGDDVNNARNRLENLIAHIASVRPFARIVVANLLLRTDLPSADQQIQSLYNPFVAGIVDHQVSLGRLVSYIDMRSCCGPTDLADGLHPNVGGYNKMADVWFSAIQTVMTVNGTATNAPAIARVAGQVDRNHVVVTFSKPVEDAAATVGNYGLSGGLNVLGAELDPSKRMVTLTTSQQAPGTSYTVTVNGVRDRINPPHTIAANSTGGFTSKAVSEAVNYNLVYSLRVPNQSDFNSMGVPYEIDKHGSAGNFSRVAYYLEMQGAGGAVQYVWVSMDGFTSDASKIGVPTVQSGAFFQGAVANMNVESSVLGSFSGVGGNVEFWPGDYGPGNDGNVAGASGSVYDFGDGAAPGEAGYGSMQVHRTASSQTVFAFNGWGGAGLINDLGIGNASGQHPDWTLAQNAGGFTNKLLQVYVLPSSGSPSTPVITTQPSNLSAGLHSTATFTVVASGAGTLTYQWRYNGSPISGATGTSYTINDVQAGNGGSYDVLVTNAGGTTPSAVAVLTVVQVGVLANGSFESDYSGWLASGNQGIATGSPWTATDGSKVVAFNWGNTTPNGFLSQSFASIPGETYALDFDAGIIAFNSSQQRLQITVEGSRPLLLQTVTLFGNSSGTLQWTPQTFTFKADSSTTTLTFQDVSAATLGLDLALDNVRVTSQNAPVIVSQPSSLTVNVGDLASFTVNATGAGLSYQWRYNSVPIPGATATTYSISNAQTSQSGSYDVVVSNGSGVTSSLIASLTVVQPSPFSNGSFESGYVGWTASGNQGVASQSSFPPTDGSKLVAFNWGQTVPDGVLSQSVTTTPGQTYTLAFDMGVAAYNLNEQRLQVTVDGTGQVLSQTLSIFGVGSGTVKWTAQSFAFVANSGSTILTFRDLSASGINIDLLLDNVRVDPQGGPTRSLTVNSENPPSGVNVQLSPADVASQGNGTTSFSRNYTQGTVVNLTAPTTVGTSTFQKWQTNGVDYTTSAATNLTMNANYTVTAVYVTPTRSLSVQSINPASGVNITVSPNDTGGQGNGSTPFPRTYAQGTVVNLTAPTTVGTSTFQKWQTNGVDYTTSAATNLTMNADYTVTAVYTGGGGLVNGSFESGYTGWTATGNQGVATSGSFPPTDGTRMVAFNWGQATPNGVLSQTFTTTVGLTYTLNFDMGVVAYNQSEQRLQVGVQGAGALLSQTLSIFGIGSGTTKWVPQSFTFVADSGATTLTFQDVSASGLNIDLLLDNVRVVSQNEPVIATQPANVTVAAGDSATFSVVANGQQPLNYQWRFNSSPITGANSSAYTIPNAQQVNVGNYDVVVSNSAGTATSSTATLSVVQAGSFSNGSFESGYAGWTATGNQGVAGTGSFPPTDGSKLVAFNWGQATPNAVLSQTFTTASGQTYSLSFDLGVVAYNQNEQRLQVSVQGAGQLLSQTLSIFGIGNGTIKWVAQTFTFVANSGTTTLTFQDISASGINIDLLLDNVRVVAQNGPNITTQPASATVNVGDSAQFSVVANGQQPLSYQWRFNTSPITGATSPSLTINNAQLSNQGSYDVVVTNSSGSITSATATLTVVQAGSFINGSFESGYTGWTATGNQGVATTASFPATDGTKMVAFNWGQATPNGVLAQAFSTTSGQSYSLSFDLGVTAYNFSEQRLRVTVQGASQLLSQTLSIFGVGNGTVKWVPQSFTFTANSGATTLTFEDLSTTGLNIDLLLDNVRVVPGGAGLAAFTFSEENVRVLPTKVLAIERLLGGWQIEFMTSSAGLFRLERSADLESWEVIAERRASGLDPIAFHDDNTLTISRFYRVILVEEAGRQ